MLSLLHREPAPSTARSHVLCFLHFVKATDMHEPAVEAMICCSSLCICTMLRLLVDHRRRRSRDGKTAHTSSRCIPQLQHEGRCPCRWRPISYAYKKSRSRGAPPFPPQPVACHGPRSSPQKWGRLVRHIGDNKKNPVRRPTLAWSACMVSMTQAAPRRSWPRAHESHPLHL